MGRPKLIDDETLLESVRSTFLELGPGVSSQELARRAGVSDGTLFRRFGTKVKLFQKAMRLPEMEEEPWYLEMVERAGKGDLEAHLYEIAKGLGDFVDQVLPAMHTVHRHGGLSVAQIRELCGDGDLPPMKTIGQFRGLFAREIRLGRMRMANPWMLGEMFVGAVLHQCHVRLFFHDYGLEDADTFARRLARDFVVLTAPDRASLEKTVE
jgi:AcrR family transcriptional regulator